MIKLKYISCMKKLKNTPPKRDEAILGRDTIEVATRVSVILRVADRV